MRASRSLYLMGTQIDLFVEGEQAEHLCQKAELMLHHDNQLFNCHALSSALAHVNQGSGLSPVAVDAELFELISWGKCYSRPGLGFLNIALGPVTRLWRIGFPDAKQPDPALLKETLSLTDARDIILDERAKTVYLRKKGMALDLGALAKGYSADRVIAYWRSCSVDGAMINLGGNVLVYGRSPDSSDGLWRVGIQHPDCPRGNHLAVLKVADTAVVTSGVYERQLKVNGKVFHHIFDPKTGYPITSDIASLTILAKEALVAETWTTALFGVSAKQAIDKINALDQVEGLIVTNNGAVLTSSGLSQYLCL